MSSTSGTRSVVVNVQPDADDKKEAKKKPKAAVAVPPNLMKLITLITLLISDADIIFTLLTLVEYYFVGLYVPMGIVAGFSLVYVGGCIIAAREANLFVTRFREKVRLNEIAGLTLEDMDQFFKGEEIPVPIVKSTLQMEQERKRKLQTGGELPSAAERLGHTLTGSHRRMLEQGDNNSIRARDDSADAAPGRENTRDRRAMMPACIGGMSEQEAETFKWVKLAPTPKEAKEKYHSDPERALFILCGHKDITFAFFRERRAFARRVVLWVHSTPLVRLMVFGWQPTVSHTDFAGILNANALYSFTIGLPQFGCTIFYLAAYSGQFLVWVSLVIGFLSIVLSIMNLVLDFPKQLFDIAQREGEAHVFALQAEERSEFWEKKMEMEVQQRQEVLLVRSTGDDGVQRPLKIIRDVIEIERECCHARVDYIANQMQMALYESKTRMAIRAGELEEIPPRIQDLHDSPPVHSLDALPNGDQPMLTVDNRQLDPAYQLRAPREALQLTDRSSRVEQAGGDSMPLAQSRAYAQSMQQQAMQQQGVYGSTRPSAPAQSLPPAFTRDHSSVSGEHSIDPEPRYSVPTRPHHPSVAHDSSVALHTIDPMSSQRSTVGGGRDLLQPVSVEGAPAPSLEGQNSLVSENI